MRTNVEVFCSNFRFKPTQKSFDEVLYFSINYIVLSCVATFYLICFMITNICKGTFPYIFTMKIDVKVTFSHFRYVPSQKYFDAVL